MARRIATAVEQNFIQGLITDRSGLNFPPNSCTEESNCVFDEKGRVTRRPAFEFEAGHSLHTINTDDGAIRGFTWKNAGGSALATFRVIQVGSTIYFFRISGGLPISSIKHATTIDLDSYISTSSVLAGNNRCSFASTNKYLIITHPECEPLLVTYTAATDAFSVSEIILYIRDFEGLEDSLAIDNRPTSTLAGLSDEHEYNLHNQGWYHNGAAALTAWDTAFSTMPSNCDVWWYYKDETDVFNTTTVANRPLGNTLAPRGHFILNLFSQDRTTASGVGSITIVSTDDRPSTCAYFAGRVFYSGLRGSGFANKIWFSQIIERSAQVGLCHQSNDPTAEDSFDLLPSDGGDIKIFEAESIIKMVPMGNALIVFCSNGIWGITGSQGLGFTATDYTVSKISSVPCNSDTGFLDYDGTPVWAGVDGVYTLQRGQNGLEVSSLTDLKIANYYNALPIRSRMTMVGAHDFNEGYLRFLFRSTESTSVTEDNLFDSMLNYNTLTGSWCTWALNTETNRIHDMFPTLLGGGGVVINDVKSNAGVDNVQANAGADEVITLSSQASFAEPSFVYLTSADDGAASYDVTFAKTLNSTTWLDWSVFSEVGEDYTSYFVTGYRLDSQLMTYFQSNYVHVYLEQETDASCLMRGRWDWTDSANSERWSTQQQIYNSTLTNRVINMRRLKVRGKGRALQLDFTSETGAPFAITGWSIWETSNASV